MDVWQKKRGGGATGIDKSYYLIEIPTLFFSKYHLTETQAKPKESMPIDGLSFFDRITKEKIENKYKYRSQGMRKSSDG